MAEDAPASKPLSAWDAADLARRKRLREHVDRVRAFIVEWYMLHSEFPTTEQISQGLGIL